MGVPKFFRWLSERYPKINQRHGCRPSPEMLEEHFGDDYAVQAPWLADDGADGDAASSDTSTTTATTTADGAASGSPTPTPTPPSSNLLTPDPLSECGLTPEIDRLYIDMNGIIHGCSHSNHEDENNNDDIGDAADGGSGTDEEGDNLREEGIIRNVCYYLDRVVREVAKPQELVYLAVDGVAPRAKLNQQRGRRYRSGKEGEIERTVYDAHLADLEAQQALQQQNDEDECGAEQEVQEDLDGGEYKATPLGPTILTGATSTQQPRHLHPEVKQVGPGRFAGKFETHADTGGDEGDDAGKGSVTEITTTPAAEGSNGNDKSGGEAPAFHSVAITPGTRFLDRCSTAIRDFVERKLRDDPAWQHLTVVYSGPEVPGEGEHKIMQFIREQQQHPDYDAARRHCIMGQDGDLILLGLATHEPNLCLLRERVLFDAKLRRFENWLEASGGQAQSSAIDFYIHNSNFEFLHMNVLRDYLALELETSNVVGEDKSQYDLERTIDDFVFLTFFVGNDFLPHMPALDIADEALDFLLYAYRDQRRKWMKTIKKIKKRRAGDGQNYEPYLTDAGEIVSGKRLENFLRAIGSHENRYYDYKRSTEDVEQLRKYEAKYGMTTTPSDQILESKEAADRIRYREMMLHRLGGGGGGAAEQQQEDNGRFKPVMTTKLQSNNNNNNNNNNKTNSDEDDDEEDDEDDDDDDEDDAVEDGDKKEIVSRMGHLLEYSISGTGAPTTAAAAVDKNNSDIASEDGSAVLSQIDDQDLKGRYYYDKFGFSPFDADKHTALRKAYVEGLVWNLKYYYEGCVSWDWYYPYHYGPMISDLVGLDNILNDISFDDRVGEPIKPFQQLMACLPPSHSSLLPEPYRNLMTDDSSPIADFYPQTFTIDMNGKRLPWEAVIMLPFIDSKRLLEASSTVDESMLSEEERRRNQPGETVVLSCDSTTDSGGAVTAVPFDSSPLYLKNPKRKPLFRPEIPMGVPVPLPGLPTLRDGSIASMWKKGIRVNNHGSKSRYKTACLEMKNVLPEMIPIDMIASQLTGTIIYINYPHFIPALVTAISDSKAVIRGQNSRSRFWNAQEASDRKFRLRRIVSRYVFGEGLVGTGGLALAPGGTAMEDLEVLLYVRPLKELKETKDGTVGKVFAKFEVEVPLFVTSWVPLQEDERLVNVPALLEKDPYHACKVVITDQPSNRNFGAGARSGKPNLSTGSPSRGTGDEAATSKFAPQAVAARSFHSFAACQSVLPPSVFLNGAASLSRKQSNVSPRGPSSWRSYSTPVPSLHSLSATATSHTRMIGQRTIIATATRSRTAGGLRLAVLGAVVAMTFFSSVADAANTLFGLSTGIPLKSNRFQVEGKGRVEDAVGADNASTQYPFERSPVKPLEFEHGTTTLSFTFRGGVVVAVDSRASLGNFVGSKTTKKVLPIHSHLLGTMAGGAADCMHWIRKLRAEASFHELTEGSRMSVARSSRLLSNWLYQCRGLGLSVGTMIAGYDDDDDSRGGSLPKIYYVDDSGMRVESDMFAVGSGSTFALGVLDVERRFDMTADEAVALAIEAIRHATFRDAASGGFINVYLITREDGWKHVFAEDLACLMDQTDGKDSTS